MSSRARAWDGVSEVGQDGDDPFAQGAVAGAGPARLAAQMRAHQRQGELTGEQLVVGKPRPCRTIGEQVLELMGPMQSRKRIGEGGKAACLEPCLVLPFRQLRNPRERRVGGPLDLALAQSFRQRVDRVDERQVGQALLVHHPVGMDHLQHAVEHGDGAGDITRLADRQELLEIVLPRVEIGERERAGVVLGVDAIGQAWPVRGRRPMAGHRYADGDDAVRHDVAQRFGRVRRSMAPVGRWNNRSTMRGSPSRPVRRAKSRSSFGPMPGRPVIAPNRGLRREGRIGAFSSLEASREQETAHPRATRV